VIPVIHAKHLGTLLFKVWF